MAKPFKDWKINAMLIAYGLVCALAGVAGSMRFPMMGYGVPAISCALVALWVYAELRMRYAPRNLDSIEAKANVENLITFIEYIQEDLKDQGTDADMRCLNAHRKLGEHLDALKQRRARL